MRIALLTDGIFPFVLGGMQKHSTELARQFALLGVEVELYHCVGAGEQPDLSTVFEPEALQNIRSHQFQFPAPGKIPGHYIRNSYRYSRSLYQQLVTEAPVDFIYAQGFAGWYALEQKKKNGSLPPIGLNFHGLNMFQTAYGTRAKLEQKLFKKPVKANLELADVVFSLGGELTQLQQQLVRQPEKVVTVPNGIDTEWINNKATYGLPVGFVFLGRFDKVKGLSDLYQAIDALPSDAPFKIDFIGPIPKEHQHKDSRCNYHGKVTDQKQLQVLISQNEVLLCPSHSEGMPTVILEAMALQLAIVATDVGATCDLVEPKGGWLIEPGNVQKLGQTLLEVLQATPDQLRAMGQFNQEKIEKRFLWSAVASQTLEAIKKYLN